MPLNVLPPLSPNQMGGLLSNVNALSRQAKASATLFQTERPASEPTGPSRDGVMRGVVATLPALRPPASADTQALARRCVKPTVYAAGLRAEMAPAEAMLGSDLVVRMSEVAMAALENEMFFERLAEVLTQTCDEATLREVDALENGPSAGPSGGASMGALVDEMAVVISAAAANLCATKFVHAEESAPARALLTRLLGTQAKVAQAISNDEREESQPLPTKAAEQCVDALCRELDPASRKAAIEAVAKRFSAENLACVLAFLESDVGKAVCDARVQITRWVEMAVREADLSDAIEEGMLGCVNERMITVARANPPKESPQAAAMAAMGEAFQEMAAVLSGKLKELDVSEPKEEGSATP